MTFFYHFLEETALLKSEKFTMVINGYRQLQVKGLFDDFC